MPDVLYVGLQEDDKIASFGIDAGSGKLVPSGETPAAGAPSVFALSPDRRVLYVGYRGTPAIESCRDRSVQSQRDAPSGRQGFENVLNDSRKTTRSVCSRGVRLGEPADCPSPAWRRTTSAIVSASPSWP